MDFLSYQIFILYYNIKHNTTQHAIQENLTKKYRISAACKEFKVEQVSKTRHVNVRYIRRAEMVNVISARLF